jgi:hypothetical protein
MSPFVAAGTFGCAHTDSGEMIYKVIQRLLLSLLQGIVCTATLFRTRLCIRMADLKDEGVEDNRVPGLHFERTVDENSARRSALPELTPTYDQFGDPER